MAKLVWDKTGSRNYETGVENGVLYPFSEGAYQTGVAWNGLTGFTQSPSGAESTPLYANNKKYLNLMSDEEFGGTIEAYTYPKEFEACNGIKELSKGIKVTQQERQMFGFSYKTRIGNDVKGTSAGYKIHLVYGAQASPSEVAYQTINNDPEAITMSWEITTTPVDVPGMKPSAHIEISSLDFSPEQMKKLEDKLYGDASEGTPTLPKPEEIAKIMGEAGPLKAQETSVAKH